MSNNKDFKVKNSVKPTVYHEGLGTIQTSSEAYSLAGAVYDSVSFSVASQDTSPTGIFFKPDGTKMYILGGAGQDVNEYALSTPWDISTASYVQVFSVANFPLGIFFKPDGTKMYITESTGDNVNEYTLSTPWNISTASYVQNFSVISQDTAPTGIFFKPDGTKMYINGATGDDVNEYTLSTAWDISTASYVQNFSVISQDNSPTGLSFKPDGTKMYILGGAGDAVNEYTLSTAWDISTASYVRNFSIAAQETNPYGLFFKDDGTKMYVVGWANDTVYQYSTTLTTKTLDLFTGSVFELTPSSNVQVNISNPADSGTVSGATLLLSGGVANSYTLSGATYDNKSFSVASQEASPAFIQFNSEGTKAYIGGSTNDVIYQYSLTTAWDISTATYDSLSYSVTARENNLRGLYIKPDGTGFYTIGIQADVVYQYSMPTPWSISTSTYDNKSFSVSSQENEAQGIFFKPDGTKMYVVGTLGVEVNEFALSTAWDVSTATFTTNYSLSSQDTAPNDLYFKSDGTKFWVTGDTNNTVYQYSCSTPWSISTASYDSVSLSVNSQEGGPQGLTFGASGTKMYVVGTVNDTVYQYSTGSVASITYPTSVNWTGGTAPTSPAIGETDVLTFTTRDGGTTYNAALAIEGAS